jgi:Zn finger protein HypA/HybF involved in hydrogenase expression
MEKLTTETYINRVKDIHEIKYDYSKTVYDGYKNDITISCPTHGDFQVTAWNHYKLKHGCYECTGRGRIVNKLEYFISKAKKIHENKYDYSLIIEYNGTMKKYPIKCPIHGIWEVTLDNHILKKSGCPKCKGIGLSNEEKIEIANQIHNNKYDYTLIKEPIRDKKKYNIKCNKCSYIFNNSWDNHTNKSQGCPKCNTPGRKKRTIESIKKQVNEMNTGYEYNWDSYKSYYDNGFEIKCHKHGWFNQQVSNHLMGQRCPKCKSSRGEEFVRKFLKDKKINYVEQKTFDSCINPKTNYYLKFDFYIPSINLCIEYDGEHHFKSIEFFGGNKAYEQTIYLDNIKNEYCQNNNINLVRISFIEFNDMENILNKIIT